MFRSFLKISLRHIWRSRMYSVINIVGLATAITCMLLAVLYWKDEHSFDDFHENNPHLYRVTTTLSENKNADPVTVGATGQVQGPAFKEGVPEVKSFVRILGGDIYNTAISNNKTLVIQPLYTDENFFDVFSYKLLRGDPSRALIDVSSVVITETTAKKFYNSIDVIGKLIVLDADPSYEKLGKPMMITGVVEDPPANSSLRFSALFSEKFMKLSFDDKNWLNAYMGTFVVLHPGSDIDAVTKKFDRVYLSHAKEQLAENSKNYGFDPQIKYGLQPITDIHLNPLSRSNSNSENGVINGSSPLYSYVFLAIASFILLMAAINFINISIAVSLKKAREVGIRKIAGSSKGHILFQFLGESAILCLVAFIISLFVIWIALPTFNSLTGNQVSLSHAIDAKLVFYFILLLLMIIGLTGYYPSWILSRFKTTEVLYSKQKLSGRNVLGKSLVIIQFSLAAFLLTATIVYYNQMDYVRTKDLGYNPNHIIKTGIGGDRDYKNIIRFMKHELSKEPSIKQVTFGNDGYGWEEDMIVDNKSIKSIFRNVDENFLSTLEIPILTGSNFTSGYSNTMKNSALVNEAFVKAAGIENPIGMQVKVDKRDDSAFKSIIGVVKDFHFGSLREPIKPMLMYMKETPDGDMWVKIEKSKQREAITALEKIYSSAMPGALFDYKFLDEVNARQYFQEQRWQKVISIATFISLIICCLGLFGLAHLSTRQRIKEIGIRKVLGASVAQIVALLSSDFLKLILLAFIIAAPLSWFMMNQWLQNFAYRISIGPAVYLLSGGIAILAALAAIGFQSIRSALSNPVKSLRTE